MKLNKFLVVVIASVLVMGIGIAGSLLSGTSAVDLSKEDKTTLASVGVAKPNITELVCDGKNCRACATGESGYGMGCISIAQEYCDSYNETEGSDNECLSYTTYTDAELKANRDEAFKARWEDIADAIRQRDARTPVVKVDTGEITINERK